ncbi:LacI family transcriptional regulator [Paenibacillus baekrokdamisoli]|uniref:LacI family transcriptional regulator n=1 Tax=Paenibacillus baekrokdamisoli TaxID=1712516 RepID=A0A3G9J9Z2_9BACL|nr:LacI family DNA-binding transcriptional regulator [Paenibacillus baekrokdamisoli]MBB3073050.1 DNA-binding LacI/PurR family transcriptional regulator [Paenibacillus baekrokdamisoli]BBH21713.1 LacI family transcriptional regulator [Paenibacillus baekrokdamisoli]
MVTKKEIAEHLGISRTAVSLVLNNTPSSTISLETRSKILQAAKDLGYRDVEVSPKLCYILYDRDANDPRYMTDLQIMEAAASRFNYGLVFMNITHAPESLSKLQRSLENQEIEGFIVSGDVDEKLVDMFSHSNTPYIFYGLPVRDKENDLNFVAFDNGKLAFDATQYLISLGHTRIALFMGSMDYHIHQLTLEGYSQAHKENGIPLDKSLIQISNDENGYELGKRAEMLQLDYSAAFCANTVIQFGVLQYLQSKGVSVPSDISLIGSGLTELVKISVPQLTTYYVSTADKERTVSLLLEIINNRNSAGAFSSRVTEFDRFEGGTASSWKPKGKQ